MTRRTAIRLVGAPVAAAAAPAAFDKDFGSALAAAAAVRSRKISAVELTKHVIARIDRHQPKLNAFVYQMRDEALAQARRVDESQRPLGPLADVPVIVKESFAIAGRPCTWGIPALQDSKAPKNSTAVQRLIDAGAVSLGATNVPLELMDGQSYNAIYGTTNNPWDLKRTPGGSSGGTAAALAAGLGFLGLGSDIGGSIRAPAHHCGIFGHKPTLDVVGFLGHSPGGQPGLPGFSTQLAVAGPMARTAEDLEAALRILGGPEEPESIAYSWKLPPPRHTQAAGFRVGYVLDDPLMPVSSEVKPALEAAVRSLEKAGAKLKPGWPAGFSLSQMFDNYLTMLMAFSFSVAPASEQARLRPSLAARKDAEAKASLIDFASWQQHNLRRLAYRAAWQRYFRDFDAFPLPVLPVPAFPHDHSLIDHRLIQTPEGKRPYMQTLLTYMSIAPLTGLPATAAPVGKTLSGLPVGIQILGPYLEDATPLRLAASLGRFTPPPGY
ncbi:MAG: amidase family protein [Bryobacteraceae bacterium]|nr:amidase family protein [Bryobacteraceae bacterium]